MPTSERTTDILTIASNNAQHRGRAVKLVSFMGTKARKWKKPGNVAKTAASVGGAFIPIPGVSIGSDSLVGKAVDRVRKKVRTWKKRKYDARYGANPNDPELLLKKIKFDVKDLDVKRLDDSVRKVRSQLQQYNQPPQGLSECGRAYNAAYRYFRAVHRVKKLKLQAEVMSEVAQEVIDFCDLMEQNLENGYDGMVSTVRALSTHEVCVAGNGCYNGERGEEALRRDAERIRDKQVDLP